ncbi:MAG: DUF72 domain-containing protein [Bacillota bacterium]
MSLQEIIKIGTCGFGDFKPQAGWREQFASKLAAFSETLKLMEVNNTFYQLPKVTTCSRWKEEAGANFEFTIKAWQGLTHPVNSPTWRKRKDKLTEKQRKELGNLRPNDSVFQAWEETKQCAEALGTSVCIVQTPASFGCTRENRDNMTKLFTDIGRGGVSIAWEPRGDWHHYPEEVKAICDQLNLIHVVDLMRREPLTQSSTAYLRMHGLNKKEYDYDYDYSTEELKQLAGKLHKLAETRSTIYCLFNNLNMHKNAMELKYILARQ